MRNCLASHHLWPSSRAIARPPPLHFPSESTYQRAEKVAQQGACYSKEGYYYYVHSALSEQLTAAGWEFISPADEIVSARQAARTQQELQQIYTAKLEEQLKNPLVTVFTMGKGSSGKGAGGKGGKGDKDARAAKAAAVPKAPKTSTKAWTCRALEISTGKPCGTHNWWHNPTCRYCGEPFQDLSRDFNRSRGESPQGDIRQSEDYHHGAQSRARRAMREAPKTSAELLEEAAAREQQQLSRPANAVPKLPNMETGA